MSVHTNPMWSSAAGQMCHTVPAAEQSWETHSFSNVFLCATLCREQVLLYRRGLLERKKIPHSRRYLISPPVFSLFAISWRKETTVTADCSAGAFLSV